MRNAKTYKPLLFLLLTGWCLLFLRCESTEKSMVRAVYLAQTEQGYQAGLLYQAPQAAADAAEASAALQFVQAEGQTMERALDAAEQALPQTASYRLCDYLLLPEVTEPLLTEYEQLVLRRGCGRTAARLLCAKGEIDHLAAQAALPGKQTVYFGLLRGQGRIARYGVQNTALLYRHLFRVPPENRQKSRLCMLIQPGCGGCCGLYLCHQGIRQGGPCGKVVCLPFCAKQPCRRATAAAPQHQLLVLC